MKKVAINGFGRIGRLAFRELINDNDLEISLINDLSDAKTLAYLLKYDSVHRSLKEAEKVSYENENLIFNDKKIKVTSFMDASEIPYKENNIEVVIECTGAYTKYEDAQKHINAGANKVIISAPGKGEMKTIVYNVNDDILDGTEKIISAASCTTNCLAPVLKIIHDELGIERGFMTTVHAFTNDQSTHDVPHKKGIESRRGRSASQNIVPSSTGAASAIGLVIPSLLGKLDGVAYRVPVADGSLIDVILELKKKTSVDEINNLFKNRQNETIKFTMDPIVSSDIIGTRTGAVVDGLSTKILEVDGKQLVKIVAWYDNEMGYTAQMIRTIKKLV